MGGKVCLNIGKTFSTLKDWEGLETSELPSLKQGLDEVKVSTQDYLMLLGKQTNTHILFLDYISFQKEIKNYTL